jgi:hypothetical protein
MLFGRGRRASLVRVLSMVVSANLLMGGASLSNAAGAVPDELMGLCRVDMLPQDIRGSLSRNFSAWKVQEPPDMSLRARTRWGAERPLTCPGIAAGHFQDPKSASYALLLIPANHVSGAFKLLIYTQQSGQPYYGFKAVGQQDTGGSDVFVATVPTDRFFDASSKQVGHSKLTEAVMLVDSAASESFVYVWSDVSYERTQVNYQ